MDRVHIWISGKVQGVCYRYNTMEQAKLLGVTGWVRNLPDGRVEVSSEGTKENLESLVKWCYQGPPAARVDHLDISWEEYLGEFQEFVVSI